MGSLFRLALDDGPRGGARLDARRPGFPVRGRIIKPPRTPPDSVQIVFASTVCLHGRLPCTADGDFGLFIQPARYARLDPTQAAEPARSHVDDRYRH